MKSTIVIAPHAYAGAVNLFVGSVNPLWDDSLTVPLSPTGAEPPTHLGCSLHGRQCDALDAALDDLAAGALPDGYSAQDVSELLDLVVISHATDGTPLAHFEAVLAANGLQRVEPIDPSA